MCSLPCSYNCASHNGYCSYCCNYPCHIGCISVSAALGVVAALVVVTTLVASLCRSLNLNYFVERCLVDLYCLCIYCIVDLCVSLENEFAESVVIKSTLKGLVSCRSANTIESTAGKAYESCLCRKVKVLCKVYSIVACYTCRALNGNTTLVCTVNCANVSAVIPPSRMISQSFTVL